MVHTVLPIVSEGFGSTMKDAVSERVGRPVRIGRSHLRLKMGGQHTQNSPDFWYVRTCLDAQIGKGGLYLPTFDDCRLACLEALFDIYFDRPPMAIPYLDLEQPGAHLRLRHYRWRAGFEVEEEPVYMRARKVWTRLTFEAAQLQKTLEQLSQSNNIHFGLSSSTQPDRLEGIKERVEGRLKRLQPLSADVTNHMAI